ncbi:putative holin [Chromobacterium sp. Panama]|uniref:putative holin n=1 Tax=Chromobacterium sp. Panama TaxID=2161826 RepID=UPI001304C32E|nr:putative holin [Chromobacterium sp. Panama]
MSESVSSATATAAVGLAGLLPYLNDGVLYAAFSGATVFVLSAKEASVPLRLVYLIPSIIIGVLAASYASSLLDVVVSKLLQRDLRTPNVIGAFLADLLPLGLTNQK